MKRFFVIIFALFSFFIQAQSPVVTVKDKDSSLVRLQQMKVSVTIVGNLAYTTTEMHFFNASSRQMEAELNFPLPEGVSVSRYAIDINGSLREAVPVNKNKGKQVFEAIEHRRVDPGLLEKTEGNNFRTRIYPLMPGNKRVVVIGYEQELNRLDPQHYGYLAVSNYHKAVDNFELTVHIAGASTTPEVRNNEAIIALENMNKVYEAQIRYQNYVPNNRLQISIPIATDIPSVLTENNKGQYYFYSAVMPDLANVQADKPNSIALLWDVSLSSRNRNFSKEYDFLATYLKSLGNVEVTLYTIGFSFQKKNNFSISNGDSAALIEELKGLVYDGGTRFSKIKLPQHDAYLFFSDGLSSLSETNFQLPKKPIHTIVSSVTADFASMHYLALQTKGNFINLNQITLAEAATKMQFRALRFLGVKNSSTVTEVYPEKGTIVSERFSISGVSFQDKQEVTLLFGYDENPVFEKTIYLDASYTIPEGISIERVWAQKKIAALGLRYKQNAEAIETLGRKYGIVTENTSLIVLENLQDYVQYGIVPPAELRAEYDRIMKEQHRDADAQKRSNMDNVAAYFNELLVWWRQNKTYVKPKPVKSKKRSAQNSNNQQGISSVTVTNQPQNAGVVSGTVRDESGPLLGATVFIRNKQVGVQTDMDGHYSIRVNPGEELEAQFVGMKSARVRVEAGKGYDFYLYSNVELDEVVIMQGYSSDSKDEEVETVEKVDKVMFTAPVVNTQGTVAGLQVSNSVPSSIVIRGVASFNADQTQTQTQTQPNGLYDSYSWTTVKTEGWNPDRAYLKLLANAPAEKWYAIYLELRAAQLTNPTYYFDVANFFYNHNQKETALKIVSNIAELGLENHQLYKSLTYVFREWGAYDEALHTARKVAVWREHEPQSHRDLALALEDVKQYQEAFDALLKALQCNFYGEMQGQYEGLEDIILMDMNRLVSEHDAIDTGDFDEVLLAEMPVAIRIVLNWNQMDTDIDLHVFEPTGEECFYGQTDTEAGARFSKDFTQGYGPEQYLLRNAVKGKYEIKTNYFGESALTENGPATVLVEVYVTQNGTTKRTLKTIQLGTVKENQNLAEVLIN